MSAEEFIRGLVRADLVDSIVLVKLKPTKPGLEYAPDFSWMRLGEREFNFADMQRKAVEYLFRVRAEGPVPQREILRAIGSDCNRLRDLFKDHDAWGELIVGKQGKYRLDLDV